MIQKISKQQMLVLLGASLFQCALFGVLFNSTGVILARIRTELGFPMMRISAYNTLRSVAGAMTGVPMSYLFFKLDKAKYLMSMVFVIVCGYLLLVVGADTWLWYFTPILQCPCAALSVIAVPYILNQWFPKNAGSVTGLAMAFSGTGGVIFNPVAAALTKRMGWRAALSIMCLFTVVLSIAGIFLMFRRKPPVSVGTGVGAQFQGRKGGIAGKKLTRLNKRFALCCICLFSGSVCTQFTSYMSMYAGTIGYSITVGAALASLIMVGNVGGKLVFGILCDVLGAWNAMVAGLLCTCSGTVGFIVFRDCLPLLYLSALLTGFAYALASIAITRCCIAAYGAEDSKRYSGVHSSISSAAGAIATLGIGALFDKTQSFSPMFLLGMTSTAISLAATMAMNRINKKNKNVNSAPVS